MKGDLQKHVARVLSAETKVSQKSGNTYYPVGLEVYGPDGNSTPEQIDASVPPWFGWLFDTLKNMVGKEDGLNLTIEDGGEKSGDKGGNFWNIVDIEGIEKPVDWVDPRPAKSAPEGGAPGKAAAPAPQQTRIAIVQALGKLMEVGMVKNETEWNAWYTKIDALVFNGKKINTTDKAKS